MDAGLTIRPSVGLTPTAAIARPAAEPAPAQQTVSTDLPAAKTVTAPQNSTPARNDLKRAEENVTRDVTLDPQTREVVYKVIDTRSRLCGVVPVLSPVQPRTGSETWQRSAHRADEITTVRAPAPAPRR